MKTKLLIAVLCMLYGANASGEASVSWFEPEKYKDVETSLEPQNKYQEKVFEKLEAYLKELSNMAPKGNKLWIKVIDLDLAGRVVPGAYGDFSSTRNVRVIQRTDFPSITFDIRTTDEKGKVLSSESIKLKDLSFLDSFRTVKEKRDELSFEKRMLKEWFNEKFPQQVAKK